MEDFLTTLSYVFGSFAGVCALLIGISLADTDFMQFEFLKTLIGQKWYLFIAFSGFTALGVVSYISRAFFQPKPSVPFSKLFLVIMHNVNPRQK